MEENSWFPPTSLFLVCKVTQKEAQAVFLALNHFIVAPTAGCHEVAESSPDPLEALFSSQKLSLLI
jgi:hypothetical protein